MQLACTIYFTTILCSAESTVRLSRPAKCSSRYCDSSYVVTFGLPTVTQTSSCELSWTLGEGSRATYAQRSGNKDRRDMVQCLSSFNDLNAYQNSGLSPSDYHHSRLTKRNASIFECIYMLTEDGISESMEQYGTLLEGASFPNRTTDGVRGVFAMMPVRSRRMNTTWGSRRIQHQPRVIETFSGLPPSDYPRAPLSDRTAYVRVFITTVKEDGSHAGYEQRRCLPFRPTLRSRGRNHKCGVETPRNGILRPLLT